MNLYLVLEAVIAILIIVTVTLQSRGSEGGVAVRTSGESYRSKRGIEKTLFYATIILCAVFALLSILALINK